MTPNKLWKYLGGKKRTNGLFGYFDSWKFRIGFRHIPMTAVERRRFFYIRQEQDRRNGFYVVRRIWRKP